MVVVYALTMFVSACLLFVVQPMFARMALPLLGGAPAVWNTAQVFYQTTLLLGYGYAHATGRWLSPRRQATVHLVLLFVSLVVLPIAVPRGWTPGAADPVPWLLVLMLVAVGLPFFLISATSPTLQHWFAGTDHRLAADPYFLYAASNIGSILALVGYPLLIEPRLTVADQSRFWAVGFGLLIVMLATCAFLAWRSPRAGHRPALGVADTPQERLTPKRRLRWVLLAFVPSSLMLSVTTYLSTDIAATPLLWVIPLGLYLLTFVIVFSRKPVLPHRVMVRALPILLLPMVILLAAGATQPLVIVMPLHVLTFFVAAMVCHGELARERPPPRYLTEFYLWMSFGGALGGLFSALIAPQLFTDITEYPLVLVLVCLLTPAAQATARPRARALDLGLPGVLAALVGGLFLIAERAELGDSPAGRFIVMGAPAVLCFSFRGRPLRFGLGVAVILLLSTLYLGAGRQVLYAERSFFGVMRVERVEDDWQRAYLHLLHGSTLHGVQSLDPERAREPLSYYHRAGPLGDVFDAFNQANPRAHVGVVGLGTGAVACYATADQRWTFFEIDPLVEDIARDDRYFSYLRDCGADSSVKLGDARLSLQDDPQQYDMLVLDAYSSDSIPMHLVTREALELYTDRLAPGGMLVFHISNRHLDLQPVLGTLAQDAGLRGIVRVDAPDEQAQLDGRTPSEWVVMARHADDLGSLAVDERWQPLRTRGDQPVWTDAYGSVLSVFRWQS